jgi:hypothetical protein
VAPQEAFKGSCKPPCEGNKYRAETGACLDGTVARPGLRIKLRFTFQSGTIDRRRFGTQLVSDLATSLGVSENRLLFEGLSDDGTASIASVVILPPPIQVSGTKQEQEATVVFSILLGQFGNPASQWRQSTSSANLDLQYTPLSSQVVQCPSGTIADNTSKCPLQQASSDETTDTVWVAVGMTISLSFFVGAFLIVYFFCKGRSGVHSRQPTQDKSAIELTSQVKSEPNSPTNVATTVQSDTGAKDAAPVESDTAKASDVAPVVVQMLENKDGAEAVADSENKQSAEAPSGDQPAEPVESPTSQV